MTSLQLSSRLASAALVAALVPVVSCNREDRPSAPPATTASPSAANPDERVVGPLTPDEAAKLATMNDRIKAYLDQHAEVERGLPALPDQATPQQIDARQRAFEQKLREARASAKPGDIFTAEARPIILRLLATVFGGESGRKLKASIMDENPLDPSAFKLSVNARYPDTVPLTTVPPQILQTLPKLTEDLEYRFVGDALILLDAHAHIIADYIENAIPK
jgi:hypothetical protein